MKERIEMKDRTVGDMKYNRFLTILADNANYCEGYIDYLAYRVMSGYVEFLIKDYGYYMHVIALLDQEDVLILTGNLDADLP